MPRSMTYPTDIPDPDFPQLMGQLRARLHRYCSRMTGSILDGEDIVQETLMKANERFDAATVQNVEGLLFRIAHNAAMDFLRKRGLERAVFGQSLSQPLDEDSSEAVDPLSQADSRHVATAALRIFMRLPLAQRSAVILTDILGYEGEEVARVMESTLPAVKAALHRGRARLRELAAQAEGAAPPPSLSANEQALLNAYADRFNARDWDGLRDLLANGVLLDLVGRRKPYVSQGGDYFTNYASRTHGLWMHPIAVEGQPCLWVDTAASESAGADGYLVFLSFDSDGRVAAIRDFRYGRYAGETVLSDTLIL